jgi:hypothetical protein
VGNALLINDDSHLRMNGNKIPMRHPIFLAAGQLQSKRPELLEALVQLINDHKSNVCSAAKPFSLSLSHTT